MLDIWKTALSDEVNQALLDILDLPDEAFYDYMFDRYTAQLVKEEEAGLRPSVRYRRYKMLYDTDYVFYGEAIIQQKA